MSRATNKKGGWIHFGAATIKATISDMLVVRKTNKNRAYFMKTQQCLAPDLRTIGESG
jgi:hypothetical protein